MSADVTKELLEALKGLLVRAADDEEYGPDHAVTVARAAIARRRSRTGRTPARRRWLDSVGGWRMSGRPRYAGRSSLSRFRKVA